MVANVLVLEKVRPDSAFAQFDCDMDQPAFADPSMHDRNFFGEFVNFSGLMEAKGVLLENGRSYAFSKGAVYVFVHQSWNSHRAWQIASYQGLALICNLPGGGGVMKGVALFKVVSEKWRLDLDIPPHHSHGDNIKYHYEGDKASFQRNDGAR